MEKSREKDQGSWRLRREVTLGALVHLLVLVGMVLAAWVNLQKELALIRYELNRLNACHQQVQQQVASLAVAQGQQEFRLKVLEDGHKK
ncbi:MAG: hypothetical protein JW709_03700 [Sedimentisphaerales bacterium]|nr:hypothetical protein [Sedimentisphaerales bacterium]